MKPWCAPFSGFTRYGFGGGAAEPLCERGSKQIGALAYDFEGRHVGLVASGPGAGEALTALARSLAARLLTVHREEGALWAWLGAKRSLDPGEIEALASRELPAGLRLAIGEPGEGISGWRLTHRQARAAHAVALRSGEPVVRYAGVALLASALQDELLRAALRDLYLEPLAAGRDGGATLRQALRAYLAADLDLSSTAISIEADGKTIASRLRAVEQRLGRPISTCAAELETALRLEELAAGPSPDPGVQRERGGARPARPSAPPAAPSAR